MSHYMTALAMKQTGLKPARKIVLYWLADQVTLMGGGQQGNSVQREAAPGNVDSPVDADSIPF